METAQRRATLRGDFTEDQAGLANILADAGESELYNLLRNFPYGKVPEFFDQVKRRYLPLRPHQKNLVEYIKNGSGARLKFIEIVQELLIENPYNGFSPTPVRHIAFREPVWNYLEKIWPSLSYSNKCVVFDHSYRLLISYTELKSRKVEHRDDQGHCENLLEFRGYIDYFRGRDMLGKYRVFKASIGIRLPMSYPYVRPHVWIDCPDYAMITHHLNVAPNGVVTIPYLTDWVEDTSDLVTLVSHLRVDFTSQGPHYPIDLGICLSDEQKKLVKILVDYGQLYLCEGIQALPANEKIAFFNKVIGRYTGDHKDLAHHIRATKEGLIEYIKIVAELLGLPRTLKIIANLESDIVFP
ncbi:unnamed protein product [Thlaspi arvense]|uniref:UEV domain-containing protein n=1 Tax=Thlaspi arvense TaxID=13288 RepID=A0AAU9SXP5_THLAR|nr:unnamed protein product [Thlaspi arvense]